VLLLGSGCAVCMVVEGGSYACMCEREGGSVTWAGRGKGDRARGTEGASRGEGGGQGEGIGHASMRCIGGGIYVSPERQIKIYFTIRHQRS
jgi:hypothetical protein